MKRLFALLVLFVGFTCSLKAQYELKNKPFMDNVRFAKIMNETYLPNNLKLADIQGSPYLSEKFEIGQIRTPEDSVFANLGLRYNAYSDELEFQKGADIYNVAFKTIVKKAEFGGSTFTCKSFEVDGTTREGFFKILAEGKATLLVRYKIRFLDRKEVGAFTDYQPARFEEPSAQYFIAFNGHEAKLFYTRKGVLVLLNDQKAAITNYLSKNKFSLTDEQGLVKLISYYNTL
jgi:hypothetical protein